MAEYIIKGGNKIEGKVDIQGAKNAVLPMLSASVLTDEEIIIENCPDILDVQCMIKILKSLGAKVLFSDGTISVCCKDLTGYEVNGTLAKEMRSSVFLLGSLISRFKKSIIALPGGCDIGKRPIDIHLSSLSKLGVSSYIENGKVFSTAKNINGTSVILKLPSVGATENLILASVFGKGKTTLYNCAKEPEIVCLVKLLKKMGAQIYGEGGSIIVINGVNKLHGARIKTIPDRIEAFTFAVLPMVCGGKLKINGIDEKDLLPFNKIFLNNTCNFICSNDIIDIRCSKPLTLKKRLQLSTGPYPEFATDIQPQTTALLSSVKGNAVIRENIFESRFKYVTELQKMGADIKVDGKNIIINGVSSLHGAEVTAPDLRGGASLVIAGASAIGDTKVKNVYCIERGYYNFVEKLKSIGVYIKRV